jgi:cytochrome oxidase Cu insertion factor (SCO1/SenC/PrrC family)
MRRRFPLPSRFQVTVTAVLVAAVAAIGVISAIHRGSSTTGESATQTRADFMGLSPAGGVAAPDIVLTDQTGQTVSLSGLEQQGKTIVLEFMDSHCTDICPIIAQEFKVAYQQLGADAAKVAFVAVNVNPFHLALADVAGFTDEQGLNTVPEWHFLTGNVNQLQQAWKAYGVAVQAPSPNTDVIHSDYMYFIDSTGHERYIASPTEDHTAGGAAYLPISQVREWGADIASVTRQLMG